MRRTMCEPIRCGLWCCAHYLALGRRGLARRRSSRRQPRTTIGLRRYAVLLCLKPSSPKKRRAAAPLQRPCKLQVWHLFYKLLPTLLRSSLSPTLELLMVRAHANSKITFVRSRVPRGRGESRLDSEKLKYILYTQTHVFNNKVQTATPTEHRHCGPTMRQTATRKMGAKSYY